MHTHAHTLTHTHTHAHTHDNAAVICLVANKIDLVESDCDAIEDGRKAAQESDMIFYPTSAKTGEGTTFLLLLHLLAVVAVAIAFVAVVVYSSLCMSSATHAHTLFFCLSRSFASLCFLSWIVSQALRKRLWLLHGSLWSHPNL